MHPALFKKGRKYNMSRIFNYNKSYKYEPVNHILIELNENNKTQNNLTLLLTNDDDCSVSLTGSEETIKNIHIHNVDDSLNISTSQENITNDFSDCTNANSESSSQKGFQANLDIEIKIRALDSLSIIDTSVNINKYVVKIPIKNLLINSSGISSFEIEEAENAEIIMSGNGYIKLENLSSNFNGCITGSGNIDICNGTLENINISISGSGDVNANIKAQKAQLSISGMGTIMVKNVVNDCVEEITGMGNILINKRG